MSKSSKNKRLKKVMRLFRSTVKRTSFNKTQLLVFVIIFGGVGAYILWTGLAASSSFVWDTDSDWNTNSTRSNTSVANGSVGLSGTISGGSGVNLPTFEYHVEPYNYDPTGTIAAGQSFMWNAYTSPTTSQYAKAGSGRVIRVNGSGNSYMSATSDYQDEWWVDWQDYFPSSLNDAGSAGYMKNFHNTPGDIGWDASPGVSGVSSMALGFNPGTNWYTIGILDGYTNDKHDFNIYQPTRDTWHSVLMHVVFGRAESGVTPKKGLVQIWVDGNNTPAVDTTQSFPGGISTIARPGSGTYAGQLQQKMTLFEGGPYNLQWHGSQPAIHRTTAMQFGPTLAQALNDTPTLVAQWGGILIPGSPTVEPGHPDAYDFAITSRNSNQFLLPSSLASQAGTSGGTTTYPASGTITLTRDAGSLVNWTSATAAETKPAGTNITYQYRTSTDGVAWSAWSSDITALSDSRYLQTQATLTTTNTAVTPTLDTLTITYDPAASSPPGTPAGLTAAAANSAQVNLSWQAVAGATSYNIYKNSSPTVLASVPAVQASVGKTSVGASLAQLSANKKRGSAYTASTDMDLTDVYAYLAGSGAAGSQTIRAGIYDMSNGVPNNLLGSSPEQTVAGNAAGAFVRFTLSTPVHVTAGQTYVLTLLTGDTNAVVDLSLDPTGGFFVDDDTYADGFSAAFGTATTDPRGISIYATGNNVLSYADSAVNASTTYTYQVSAVNSLGESAKSTAATATTPAAPADPPVYLGSNIVTGDTLSGTKTWTATVSGSVASVEFWANGTRLFIDPTAPYSYDLDTTTLPNGSNNLGINVIGTDGTKVTAGTGGVMASITVDNAASLPNTPYPWDFNKDGAVDVTDLSIMLSHFGQSATAAQGDLNNDGVADVTDLSIFLSHYGI